jgi:hypothetical protein
MATKRVAILLTIDVGEQEKSCYSARLDDENHHHLGVPGADETYLVGVYNSNAHREHALLEQPNAGEMMDCAAHELGHVLSQTFKIPEAVADPRGVELLPTGPGRFPQPNADQIQRILAGEKKAWEVALQIRPSIDRVSMSKDLASYAPEGYGPRMIEMAEDADGGLVLPQLDKIPLKDRKGMKQGIAKLRDLLNSDKVTEMLADSK